MKNRVRVSLALVGLSGGVAYGVACGADEPATPDAGSGSPDASSSDALASDAAPMSDSASGDSGIDAGPCDLTKAFGTPTMVVGINGAPVAGARLSPDQLTIYFHSHLGLTAQIFTATRPTATDPFATPTVIVPLGFNDAGGVSNGANPTVSTDGLSIYYEHTVGGTVQIMFATRATKTDEWSPPSLLPGLISPANAGQAYYVAADGPQLYFVSRDAGTQQSLGANDIYRTKLTAPGVTAAIEHVTEISTINQDLAPVVSDDGLTIYYEEPLSDGGLPFKIWTASRLSLAAPFANLTQIDTLTGGGPTGDTPNWISPDRCTFYLTSDRGGTSQIYFATRPK